MRRTKTPTRWCCPECNRTISFEAMQFQLGCEYHPEAEPVVDRGGRCPNPETCGNPACDGRCGH